MIGKGYILNHKWFEKKDDFKENRANAVYEVIRIINGKSLFLEDHIDRLKKSLCSLDLRYKINEKQLNSDIEMLIKRNEVLNNNFKIEYWIQEFELNMQIYLIESSYPTDNMIYNGVDVISAEIERENPNDKIYRVDYKNEIKNIIEKENVFEVLLINSSGLITEGSRSNFFYLINKVIYTSSNEHILSGVTRNNVVKCIKKLGIKIVYDNIAKQNIDNIEAAFLTGTSINILPIKKVNSTKLESGNNDIIKKLIREFDLYRENSMK